jgi:hypothetical protein
MAFDILVHDAVRDGPDACSAQGAARAGAARHAAPSRTCRPAAEREELIRLTRNPLTRIVGSHPVRNPFGCPTVFRKRFAMGEQYAKLAAAWKEADTAVHLAEDALDVVLENFINNGGPVPSEAQRIALRDLRNIASDRLAELLTQLASEARPSRGS